MQNNETIAAAFVYQLRKSDLSRHIQDTYRIFNKIKYEEQKKYDIFSKIKGK